MKINFLQDFSLRGYSFEYIAKVLLRRKKKNNFIFQTNQFDDIDELLKKYRFEYNQERISQAIACMQKEGLKGDLIEFIVEKNEEKRVISDMLFYDVKTKYCTVKSPGYYEMCKSDMVYFKEMKKRGFSCQIISVLLLPSWEFTFTLVDFRPNIVRVYSRFRG